MGRLVPDVPYDPAETLHSWVARLAAVHTGLGTDRILADLGVCRDDLARGGGDAIARLAEATGAREDQLRAGAIVVRLRDVLFRGADFAKASLSPRVDRVCPACLAEDGGRANLRHRLIWCVRPVRWCLRHGTPLHATSGGPSIDIREVEIGSALPSAMPDPPAYATWVADRLRGAVEPSGWLEAQTMEQVLTASGMLGAVLLHGHGVRATSLDDEQREAATDRGFASLLDSPEGVDAALDDIRAASHARAAQAGPLAMYGGLYDWLDRRANHLDPGPIRSLLRNHIVRHSALAAGEIVLGEAVDRRLSHTIGSLSAVTGIERRRLGRLLVLLGHVPAELSDVEAGRIVFPAVQLEQFCADLSDAVLLHDVPDYLLASRYQVQAMYAVGILKTVVPVEERGEVRNVAFARRHLDDVLDRIEALPVRAPVDAVGMLSIAETCRRGASVTVDLIGRILDGMCPAARMEGPPGVDRILVLPGDVVEMRNAAA